MQDYDRTYAETIAYFGEEPTPLLLQHLGEIKPGGRVLDIGVGQGRNALALARAGFQVTGIDPSAEAVAQTLSNAAGAGLAVQAHSEGFQDYVAPAPFDAVLCFGLMQILSRAECASLLHRIYEWTDHGSLLLLTAWHVDDPSYERISDEWEPAGLHSFRNADGEHRTFLARGIVRNFFRGWETLHHKELLGPPHRHGDGTEHQHGEIHLAVRRR
jgi:cyclopropane fatty-acyl-phospholipid synthase-like methyltransferase